MKGQANVTNPVATDTPAKRFSTKRTATKLDGKVRPTVSKGTQGVRRGRKPSARKAGISRHNPQNASPSRQRKTKEPIQEAWDLAKELEDSKLHPSDKVTVAATIIFLILIGLLLGRVI